jgi:hypothetical protein
MVRYTLVPSARGWEFLDRVHAAVPESPATVEDCCGYLQEHTPVPTHEHAREWLVFLRSLNCVAKDENGYYRIGKPDHPEELAEAFQMALFGVTEILSVLSDKSEPLTVDAVCELLDPSDRGRLGRGAGTSESAREAVERRLQWAHLFGLVSRRDDQYEPESSH